MNINYLNTNVKKLDKKLNTNVKKLEKKAEEELQKITKKTTEEHQEAEQLSQERKAFKHIVKHLHEIAWKLN